MKLQSCLPGSYKAHYNTGFCFNRFTMSFAIGALLDNSVEVFPLNWMIDERSCYWAPFRLDGSKFKNAVAHQQDPSSSWTVEQNVRILAKYGEFIN